MGRPWVPPCTRLKTTQRHVGGTRQAAGRCPCLGASRTIWRGRWRSSTCRSGPTWCCTGCTGPSWERMSATDAVACLPVCGSSQRGWTARLGLRTRPSPGCWTAACWFASRTQTGGTPTATRSCIPGSGTGPTTGTESYSSGWSMRCRRMLSRDGRHLCSASRRGNAAHRLSTATRSVFPLGQTLTREPLPEGERTLIDPIQKDRSGIQLFSTSRPSAGSTPSTKQPGTGSTASARAGGFWTRRTCSAYRPTSSRASPLCCTSTLLASGGPITSCGEQLFARSKSTRPSTTRPAARHRQQTRRMSEPRSCSIDGWSSVRLPFGTPST